MRVIVKRPGEVSRYEEVENTLKALQELVGGLYRDVASCQ